MEYCYLTDPGKVRDHNEDSVTVVKNVSDEILMAVADGMGGHRGGEIASSIAINVITDYISIKDNLNVFVSVVDEGIYDYIKSNYLKFAKLLH